MDAGFQPGALSVSGNVEARSYVPHDAVLPSVDLVVTHAGFGTLMFSAGAGKPALCLPNGRDQNDNAARAEALGLGYALAPEAAPAEIGGAIMQMLGDKTLRTKSRSFAAGVSRFGDLARGRPGGTGGLMRPTSARSGSHAVTALKSDSGPSQKAKGLARGHNSLLAGMIIL
jgi:hypothetical protein